MNQNNKFSCKLCRGKIRERKKNGIFAPGDFIYLIPAKVCSYCKALHNLQGEIIFQKDKIAFWEETKRKVIFETIDKTKFAFQNISATQ